jgi:hypothetical protein
MSYTTEALASTLTAAGEVPFAEDIEMMAAKPIVVAKADDKGPQEDAAMEDLFGNDDDMDAKEEGDIMNLQG